MDERQPTSGNYIMDLQYTVHDTVIFPNRGVTALWATVIIVWSEVTCHERLLEITHL